MLIFRRLLYKDVEQIDEAKEFNDERLKLCQKTIKI
jgi:hypothetical protein